MSWHVAFEGTGAGVGACVGFDVGFATGEEVVVQLPKVATSI